MDIGLVYSLSKRVAVINIRNLLQHLANLPCELQVGSCEAYRNLCLVRLIALVLVMPQSNGILTAVTLLTTPMTVDAAGSRFPRGDARSNASLNLSSGTWIERRYATPRRKADC